MNVARALPSFPSLAGHGSDRKLGGGLGRRLVGVTGPGPWETND